MASPPGPSRRYRVNMLISTWRKSYLAVSKVKVRCRRSASAGRNLGSPSSDRAGGIGMSGGFSDVPSEWGPAGFIQTSGEVSTFLAPSTGGHA
eukprot:1185619-Prorocentrum_minimum.AAC.3